MRVALCQMRSGEDVEENLVLAEGLVGEAADGGADLAALPEVFTYLGSAAGRSAAAEPVPGPTTERLAAVARARSMWVLGGSVIEAAGDHRYATSVLLDRDGELVATYRKIHLFDVDLPGQPPFRESASYAAGDQLVTHETDVGRVGLSICYDVRFPELYRGLMVMGAEVLFVPAQFQFHDRDGSLGGPVARARDREPVLRGRARPVGDVRRSRRRAGVRTVTRWWSIRGGGCWRVRPRRATASGSRTST